MIEATKGINSYYLTSDGGTMSYRTRIRTQVTRTCNRSPR
jgi:NADH-quinone oxidoreductase subunit C/D